MESKSVQDAHLGGLITIKPVKKRRPCKTIGVTKQNTDSEVSKITQNLDSNANDLQMSKEEKESMVKFQNECSYFYKVRVNTKDNNINVLKHLLFFMEFQEVDFVTLRNRYVLQDERPLTKEVAMVIK